MRYSMLVYLTNMGKTLLEAAKYLRTSENRELQADLLENGRQMIGQICSELKRYGSDLYSSIPLELIRCIEGLWNKTGKSEELEETLRKFIQILPNEIKYQVRAVFFCRIGRKMGLHGERLSIYAERSAV